jgi:chromosome segregation ATPase
LTASINVLGFSNLEALSDFIYLHGSATVIPSKSLPPTTLDESQSQIRNDPIQRDNRHQERRLELFTLQKHVERLEVDVKFQKGEVVKLEGTAQDQTRIIEGLRRDNAQLHNKLAKVENDEQSSLRIQLLEADNNLLEETVARLRFELQRSAPIVSPTIIVAEDQDPADQAELTTSQGHSDCYNQIEDLDRQVNSLKEQLDLASRKYDLLQVVKDELNVKLDAEGGCRRDTEVRLDESRKKYKSLERQTKTNGYSTSSAATTP